MSKTLKRLFCIGLTFCIGFGAAYAQKSFNVATGDWNVAGNWNPVGVPAITDAVTIPAGRSVTVVGTGSGWWRRHPVFGDRSGTGC